MGQLATVGSEAGWRVAELGVYLSLLACAVLVAGALRFGFACQGRWRVLLTVGLVMFALGHAGESLVRLGALEIGYYPGWREDMTSDFYESDAEVVYSAEDLAHQYREPHWWEAIFWWGQRFARIIGVLLATTAFVCEGRALMRTTARRRIRPAGKSKRTA